MVVTQILGKILNLRKLTRISRNRLIFTKSVKHISRKRRLINRWQLNVRHYHIRDLVSIHLILLLIISIHPSFPLYKMEPNDRKQNNRKLMRYKYRIHSRKMMKKINSKRKSNQGKISLKICLLNSYKLYKNNPRKISCSN